MESYCVYLVLFAASVFWFLIFMYLLLAVSGLSCRMWDLCCPTWGQSSEALCSLVGSVVAVRLVVPRGTWDLSSH